MGNFVTMPKLGMTMTEGVIVQWLVVEGAHVEKGDYIFEVETDKTSLEVDSLYEGILLKTYYEAGDTVLVNEPVAFIGAENEEVPPLPEPQIQAEMPADAPVSSAPVSTAPIAASVAIPTAAKTVTAGKAAKPEGGFEYDLIVIGAGPGGYVAAIRAAQLGAKVAIIEKDTVGGTCLNRGCIPTKAYYASARRFRDVSEADAFGISAGKPEVDWQKVLARKQGIVKTLTGGVAGLLKKNGITTLTGTAEVINAHEVKVGDKTYTCAYTIIATGGKPASIIKTDARLLNTDDILDIEKLPKSILIIGGGVIGCELAGIFNTLGTETSVVELMPRILPMTDSDISAALTNKMIKNGINIYTETTCEEIKQNAGDYTVTLSNGETVNAEIVLEAVGRTVVDDAFKNLDIERSQKGRIVVNDFMETSIPYIYAIGDVNGITELAHAASDQGITAVEHLFGNLKTAEKQAVPSCIFTDLEIACVGLTEEQAREQGLPVNVAKFPYAANGKALTLGETEGFVKVIADKRYGEILGVHIIGAEASCLIEEAVMAMRCEATAESAASTIHPHPTLTETLMEGFLGVSKGMIHMH